MECVRFSSSFTLRVGGNGVVRLHRSPFQSLAPESYKAAPMQLHSGRVQKFHLPIERWSTALAGWSI